MVCPGTSIYFGYFARNISAVAIEGLLHGELTISFCHHGPIILCLQAGAFRHRHKNDSACVLHSFIADGWATLLLRLLSNPSQGDAAAAACCRALRSMLTPDDDDAAASRVFANARSLAADEGAVKVG